MKDGNPQASPSPGLDEFEPWLFRPRPFGRLEWAAIEKHVQVSSLPGIPRPDGSSVLAASPSVLAKK